MKQLFLVFIFILSGLAYSAERTEADIVSHIQYYSGHTGLLVRQPKMVKLEECPRNDLYQLNSDHPHYKEMTSLILAAHIAGQKLEFVLSGCNQSLPAILHVYSDK
ncbi:hypothetical protein SAMN02745866_01204 [Alteromonadaceae bacterium Bs31]|nr:hypothetical protein SAMN02745866_01204 [Alteromonadaceae bacterium Bs31]